MANLSRISMLDSLLYVRISDLVQPFLQRPQLMNSEIRNSRQLVHILVIIEIIK